MLCGELCGGGGSVGSGGVGGEGEVVGVYCLFEGAFGGSRGDSVGECLHEIDI